MDLKKSYLGIEFGSTRIKAVLIDAKGEVLAIGIHDWENRFENGVWTYTMDDIITGLQTCYADLKKKVKEQYGITIDTVGAMGISAMMHGYLAFDKEGNLLVPFRTWRNTITGEAADKLTKEFDFNIPQRWTISHLYQAILNGEDHLPKLDFVTTLDSYIHCLLTGEKVTGVGDASGIFPIDSTILDYDQAMLDKFDALIADKNLPWKVRDVLPKVLVAGENAGTLTAEGAKVVDPDGDLKPGIVMAPPEGDAGTGMVATNAVGVGTGNISAGTSSFAMVVLQKALSKLHTEIDMVTTPDGAPCAMAHANNGTSDINAWVSIFAEVLKTFDAKVDMGDLYTTLFEKSLQGSADCGKLLTYGYFSGEPVTGVSEGRPVFARSEKCDFTLANFMRANIYSSLGAVIVGMDILKKEENVEIKKMVGHGGLFKTKGVASQYLADAIDTPVTVLATAGEGGPWGMAVLASYVMEKQEGEALQDYLDRVIFASLEGNTSNPTKDGVEGFAAYMDSYRKGIAIEKAAIETI